MISRPVADEQAGNSTGRGRGVRFSRWKSYLVVLLDFANRWLPFGLVDVVIAFFAFLGRLTWWLPGNPMRATCRHVTELASLRNISHDPHQIYREWVSQQALVARGFFRMRREGPEAVLDWMGFAPDVMPCLKQLVSEHGGLLFVVPHTSAATFAAIGLAHHLDVLVLVRNRKDSQHSSVARDMFERMNVNAMLVRDESSTRVTRACFRALREGKVVVCTMDYHHRKEDAIWAKMFELHKRFAPWAVRFASKTKKPLIPCYPYIEGGKVRAWLGEPMLDPDPEKLTQHYVSFFDQCILKDPQSWAFLADKRWRLFLEESSGYQVHGRKVSCGAHY